MNLVSQNVPNVEFLRLEFIRNVTSASIAAMASEKLFPKLRRLFLGSLLFVRTRCVQDLVGAKPSLEVIKEDNGLITFQKPSRAEDPDLYTRFFYESQVNPSLVRLKEMQKAAVLKEWINALFWEESHFSSMLRVHHSRKSMCT